MRKVYDGFVLIMVALVDTLVGSVVEFENSIGIAQTSGLAGEKFSVDTVGVYELPSADADVIEVGNVLYYDSTNGVVTVETDTVGDGTGTLYTKAGISWSAKAGGAVSTVDVKIG